jgi:hypothetical protein
MVKALDTEPPHASVPTTIDAGSVPVTFTEPTVWADGTSQTALTVVDVATTAPVAGTWTCTNVAHLTVTCDASGAKVTRATFTPTVPLTAEHEYAVRSAPSSIYDLSGNELATLDVDTTTN